MRTVILICAGRAERWGGYLGVPKHLIEIDGEKLLHRTVRQVRERGDAGIHVVADDPAYAVKGAALFPPRHGPAGFCDTDKFLSSVELWLPHDQTVILYGDVFFTDAAMDRILAHRGPFAFFGRPGPSAITGCRWQELFAISMPPSERGLLHTAMREVRGMLTTGMISRGGGWEVYRHALGLMPVCLPAASTEVAGRFVEINDFTEDFDFPRDYDDWLARWHARARIGG